MVSEVGSPNQRLMSRITRSTLPITEEMLKPAVIENVKSKLQVLRGVQAKYANQNKKEETTPLKTGDAVRIETSHRNWIAGKVIAETQNPRSVVVKTNDGKVIRRNSTHLHKTIAEIPTLPKATVPTPSEEENPSTTEETSENEGTKPPPANTDKAKTTRAGRTVKAPQRLDL
uniref:Uncharacterized protein n=1 Tax=Photinus pyralis TaxID=7054 RepID=A0A1Y1JVN9_PHOPY